MEKSSQNKKPSSYQKMKKDYQDRIQRLNDDIKILVENKSHADVVFVNTKYKLAYDIEKMIWSGNDK